MEVCLENLVQLVVIISVTPARALTFVDALWFIFIEKIVALFW